MTNFETHKEKLTTELQTLVKALQELGVQNPQVPEDWIATPDDATATEADEGVVAERSEDWIGEQAETAALETRYNNVKRALTKLEAGTYGTCEICNTDIEGDRLAANAAARTCKTHLENESQLAM